MRNQLEKVGVSPGLTHPCKRGEPEQLYVWKDPHNEERPILVEGWVGYDIDARLAITRKQAAALASLLVEALT